MYEPKQFWWQKEKDAHRDIFDAVQTLVDDQDYHGDDNLNWLRLFQNKNSSGLTQDTYSRFSGSRSENVTLNIVHSMCTTVTSKIAKN